MLDPNGIDVLVPLGRGSQFRNAELKYALRSLGRFAKGVRRVVVVGSDPKFLASSKRSVEHFPCPWFDTNKEARIALKVQWAFNNIDLTDDVLFINDDYVFLKEFDVRKVKPFQRGKLLDSATRRLLPDGNKTAYQKSLLATHEALTEAELPAFHYDIHVPIIYNRKKFLGLSDWWTKSQRSKAGLVAKSVYSNNFNKKPGPKWSDFKLARKITEEELKLKLGDRWVFSYSDRAMLGGLERILYKWFPEKSRFEK